MTLECSVLSALDKLCHTYPVYIPAWTAKLSSDLDLDFKPRNTAMIKFNQVYRAVMNHLQ